MFRQNVLQLYPASRGAWMRGTRRWQDLRQPHSQGGALFAGVVKFSNTGTGHERWWWCGQTGGHVSGVHAATLVHGSRHFQGCGGAWRLSAWSECGAVGFDAGEVRNTVQRSKPLTAWACNWITSGLELAQVKAGRGCAPG